MIYFIYGEDSYRSKKKLDEIVESYRKIHKSGLNLIYTDAKQENFDDFYSNFKITSMFAEKKLVVLKNVFDNSKFQESFLKNVKVVEDLKDIIVVYEDAPTDKRTKFFKALTKNVPTHDKSGSRIHDGKAIGTKCQEFNYLQPAMLKRWVAQEFSAKGGSRPEADQPQAGASGGENNKIRINPDALDLLVTFVKSNLWQMANEINKLSNYKKGSVIKKEDVELLVRPNIKNDIFKTIDALASKDKKQALSLLHKHLDNGDNPLYLLSMISYQFRNLLVMKELQDMQKPYASIVKKSGLHPFVVQKSYYLCNQFSIEQLKKIYQKIFQADSDIKTGKIEPELALDLLLAEI